MTKHEYAGIPSAIGSRYISTIYNKVVHTAQLSKH